MNYELITLTLSSDLTNKPPRECQMSAALYQNARMTMGELCDIMRQIGISWDFISYQIDLTNHPLSPLDKALRSMDPYTTGPSNSLRDLPSNVW